VVAKTTTTAAAMVAETMVTSLNKYNRLELAVKTAAAKTTTTTGSCR
jgi:hypothetical protein